MDAAEILASLRSHGATVWLIEGGHLAVAPRSAIDDGLRADLSAHKADLLAALNQERWELPILRTQALVQTDTGVELIEIQPIDPTGPIRWEKRLVQGACALVGEVTTDPNVARIWIKALWGSQAGKKGVA